LENIKIIPAALIVTPNFEALKEYCNTQGIPYTASDAEMISNQKSLRKYDGE